MSGKSIFVILFVFSALLQKVTCQELIILNDTLEWEYDRYDRAYNWFPLLPWIPTNWIAPHDYFNGQIYTRYEVISQPTNEPFALQFGIWQGIVEEGQGELMEPLRNLEGGAGSLAVNNGIPATWWMNENGIDFSRVEDFWNVGLNAWSLDPRLPIADAGWGGSAELWANQGNWFPLVVYGIVVGVAEGHTFSGWENYIGIKPTPGNVVTDTSENEYNLKIGPNPAKDFLYIISDISPHMIKIYNICGNLVQINNEYSSNPVNIQHIQTGMYIVKIYIENKVFSKKLIIQ